MFLWSFKSTCEKRLLVVASCVIPTALSFFLLLVELFTDSVSMSKSKAIGANASRKSIESLETSSIPCLSISFDRVSFLSGYYYPLDLLWNCWGIYIFFVSVFHSVSNRIRAAIAESRKIKFFYLLIR